MRRVLEPPLEAKRDNEDLQLVVSLLFVGWFVFELFAVLQIRTLQSTLCREALLEPDLLVL